MGRNPSECWKHFEKIDKNSARCRYCDKVIVTSGNTSNLKAHHEAVHTDKGNPTKVVNSKRSKSQSTLNLNPPASSSSTATSALTGTSSTSASSSNSGSSGSSSSFGPSLTSGAGSTPGVESSTNSSSAPAKNGTSNTSRSRNNSNIKDCFSNLRSFQEGGQKHEKLTDKILFMLCKDHQPLATVEREGFKELMNFVAPQFKQPCRKTLARRLDKKYAERSEYYIEYLKGVKDMTLTTDLWTETTNSRSYLGITAHFLEGSEMTTITLGVYDFSESHTADNIKEKLEEVCFEWGITKAQISAIVTDNASNIKKAVKEFVSEACHLGCSAHKVHLVATNSIKSVEGLIDLIQKVKSIVTWFKQSNKASADLREATELKLKQDVVTRWNSTYYMLVRFILLCSTVNAILYNYPAAPPMITPRELEELSDVCKMLEPLEEVTRELSAEKYVTISKVIPMINSLVEKIELMKPKHIMTKKLKIQMLAQIKKQFDGMENRLICAIATLLDPRFKKLHFKNQVAASLAENHLKAILQKRRPLPDSEFLESGEDEEIVLASRSKSILRARHERLVKQDKLRRQRAQSTNEMADEVDLYLRSPVADYDEDPIKLWMTMAPTYPELAEIAFKYLPIMATSVPSERLFSKAGENMTARRNRLSGSRLHKQLFLSSLPKHLW